VRIVLLEWSLSCPHCRVLIQDVFEPVELELVPDARDMHSH